MTAIYGDARTDLSKLGKYQIIVADPPWHYADQRRVRKNGKTPTKGIGACHHYSLLKVKELCKLPVGDLSLGDSQLYLWATCPLLPDAFQVMNAWGYAYSTIAYTWVKLNSGLIQKSFAFLVNLFEERGLLDFLEKLTCFGPGTYTGSNIELVLLGRKGKALHHAKGHKASQVVYAPRGKHSRKPEIVQDRIGWMYPDAAPRLELFATRDRVGWDCFGNDSALKERSGDEGFTKIVVQ